MVATKAEAERVVVVGCGNPLLAADSVGVLALLKLAALLAEAERPASAEGLRGRASSPAMGEVTLIEACTPGVALIEALRGRTRAVILDATEPVAESGTDGAAGNNIASVGGILCLGPEPERVLSALAMRCPLSLHGFDVGMSLQLGYLLFPGELPSRLHVLAVPIAGPSEGSTTEEKATILASAALELLRG